MTSTAESAQNVPVASLYTLMQGQVRMEEQLKAVVQRVEYHMAHEHGEFKEALNKVEELYEKHDELRDELRDQASDMQKEIHSVATKVDNLYFGAKWTRWLAVVIATLVGWFAWLKDHITFIK